MKILFLSKRIYTNKDLMGDRYGRVYEFSRSLADQGHQVCGIAFDYRRGQHVRQQSAQEVRNPEWHVRDLFPNPVRGISSYIVHVARLIKEFSPDVLLSVSDVYHVILGDWLSRRFGITHIVDLYDDYESFGAARMPGAVARFRRAVARADGIICVSQQLKRHVIDTCKPGNTPAVITNAVDTDLFKPGDGTEYRRRFGLPGGKKLIGLGGAISEARGIRSVFQAHQVLSDSGQDIHLVLAGAMDKTVNIPETGNIHYLGQLEYQEMPLFFGALDVGIIINSDSSFARYCFPQKYFEMLACKLPIVVTAIGDVKDMMKGCSQALFQPGDINGLADAIRLQLDKPCRPEIDVLSWRQQGVLLSEYVEKKRKLKTCGMS